MNHLVNTYRITHPTMKIQTRLDQSSSEASRRGRKYSTPLIWEALSLAKEIGVTKAAKATGIEYRRLVRLICADRRSRSTLREELQYLDWYAVKYRKTAESRRELATMLKNDLIMKIEVLQESYRIASRTRASFWNAVKYVALRRGLRGKTVCELVREGRIPTRWFDGSQSLQQQPINQ